MEEKTHPLNWADIHRRLERSRQLSEQNFAPAPEKKARLLKERARLLAQAAAKPPAEGDFLAVTTFLLANERYAVELSYIRDVYALKETITPIPCTPPFMAGIVNVRGQILPVIDLKRFFGLPQENRVDLKHIIILSSDQTELGLMADAVAGIQSVPVAAIQTSFFGPTDMRGMYVKGITLEPLIILDPVKILSDRRIVVDEEV